MVKTIMHHLKYRRQIMNKKGFTLIELSISVALLSVVIIYLLYFLKTVRDEDEGINAVTEMELDKAIISKTINSDILNEGNINNFTCLDGLCTIYYNSGKIKTLKVGDNTVIYKDITDKSNPITLLNRNTSLNYRISLPRTLTTIHKIIIYSDENNEYNIDLVSAK